MRLDDLDTPFLAVDLDAFEDNVAATFARLAHVRVRPHQKTAKCPEVAHALVRAGARGICVAKLSEAEVMLDAGLDDVLITTELAGSIKARRLAAAVARFPDARIAVVVDSIDGAVALDAALDRPVDALIEVNVGQDRCGVAPEDAGALAAELRALSNLRVRGVQGYEGHLQLQPDRARSDAAMARLRTAVDALGGAEWVTTGGTGTAAWCAAHDFVTEVQPGSFVFMDAAYLEASPGRPALTAHATVISANQRAVVDAGLKTLSNDLGPAHIEGGIYAHAGDEHGLVDVPGLGVGDRVTLIPSHGDTTVNLHDVLYAHRDGEIEAEWRVSARGKVA